MILKRPPFYFACFVQTAKHSGNADHGSAYDALLNFIPTLQVGSASPMRSDDRVKPPRPVHRLYVESQWNVRRIAPARHYPVTNCSQNRPSLMVGRSGRPLCS